MTHSESVREYGLFEFVGMEIRRKKEEGGYKPVSGQWFAPAVGQNKTRGKGKIFFVATAPEPPVRKIIPMSDCASVEDLELEVSPDDPSELTLVSAPIEAGEDVEDEQGAEQEHVEAGSRC
jgi:hypothetical protein